MLCHWILGFRGLFCVNNLGAWAHPGVWKANGLLEASVEDLDTNVPNDKNVCSSIYLAA